MSAKAKRGTAWAIILMILALFIFVDLANTSAGKQKGDASSILDNLLRGGADKANAVVGVCNSTDPALNTLQAAVDAELTYAQVDSITRVAVNRGGGLQSIIDPGDWVIIKPNFLVVPGVTSGTYTWAHNGVTTDLRVIKSVIQQLVEEGDATRITIAEGATWRKNGDPVVPEQTVDGWTYHWSWFGGLSVEDMIAEFSAAYPGITFDYIDLNYPPYTSTPVPGGGLSQDSYYVPDALLQCDKLIAIAAMKTHSMTRVTLTSKLYVGVSPASVYRSGAFDHLGIPHNSVGGVPNAIERTLVDLMSYHPPDFGIVECFWGTQGAGPLGGSAIQRNLVIAGRDPIAVDAVSTYTMGMNPWDIDHLHWAHAKGFGVNDLRFINTVGPDLDDLRYNFARAKAQGRANRIWLLHGTHAGTDLDVDMLSGEEATIDPIEGQMTNGKTWTAFTDVDDYMDLAKEYSYPSSCIVYAFTRVYSDEAKSVRLRFGVDDGIKIWLNGSVVYTSSAAEGYSLTAHDLAITLQAGENRLLVKTRNTSGSYGFGLCVSESSGDTPLGITYDIQSPGAPQITLNTPVDEATVTDSFVTLSASVSDPDEDSITVLFYGDTASAASELLYSEKVASGSTVEYTWQARRLTPTTGTFGLWHFDENVGSTLYDATGRGHDGAWHCDSTLADMWTDNSAFGYGLDFFGYHTGTPENPCGADYVEVPDDPDLDVDPDGQLTMEFWINPDCLPPASGYTCDTARYWGIFTKRVPCVPPQDTVGGCGSAANYCIFYNYPTQTIGFYGNTSLYTSTCTLTTGVWQYIVVTVDGATQDLRFYKNGALVQARTGDIGSTVDGPLRIGASAYRRKGVDGKIDELRLSRRILTAEEIADNYKLAAGTYYWRVAATDGVESTNSPTRSFTVTESGGGDPPGITMNSPANGASTANNYMHLNASVTSDDAATVWFYGGTTSDPGDLLYVRENVTGTETFDYNWNLKRFDPETGHTMGLWRFDEGLGGAIDDESGNGNGGTASGSPVWSVDGRFGYALDFDGTDDYFSIPDAASLDVDSATGELTIEGWIYPHASGSSHWRSIISKKAIGGAPVNYQISLDQTTGNLLFYSGHWPQIWVSSVAIPLNQWSYVAVTLKATEGRLRFYRNGVLLDSTVTYGGNGGCFGAASSTVLTIGTAGGTTECFDGLMDEVRLTNRALSSTEIAANYTDGLTTGTYYWQVAADDGAKTLVESGVRNFYVGSAGPDDDPPAITLTAPDDMATTSNPYMTLSATVSDESPTTVWVYGDTASDPTALLHVQTGVIGNQSIDYSWNASRLTVESPYTMGLWHADDASGTSLADASGNGNTGTFVGAPAWSTAGKFGYALDLDGTDDYVTIPDANSLDIDSATGELTIEGWIYPHASGASHWRSIISKKAIGGAAVNYQISLDMTTGNLLFYSGHWPQIWISSVSIPLNQWSYVAVTLKATEGRLRFYRNGALLDSTVTYLGNGGCFGAASSTVLTIGTAGGISECFDGLLDDFRLTRRALTSAEIAANYKLGDGVYHWKVTATDSLTNSATAGPRQFTVNTSPAAPAIPTLLTPANLATITDNTPTFTWSATAGAGGTYTLEYSTDVNFGVGPTVTVSGLTAATHTPTTPLDNDVWYWHVEASNGYGSSGYQTTPFSFTLAADTDSPDITLNAPADGALTSNHYMDLDFNVSDASPMTVWVYGDTSATPTDLLYVQQNVTSGNIVHTWSAPVLRVEAGNTMGLWHLDEGTGTTFADASGNGNTGTFVTAPAWAAGRFGYGLDFDGTTTYASIPDAASLDVDSVSGAATIEAWIYPHASGGGIYRSFIAKRAMGATPGPCNYQLSLNGSNGNLLFYNGNTTTGIYVSSVSIPLNQWSHVAVSLSATEGRLRFYRNGVLLDSTITGAAFGAANSEALYLGLAARTTECFDGVVDEVRITNRLLTSAEIAANYALQEGRYYWTVVASDGSNPATTSATRYFDIGPDVTSPVITLLSPADDATTPDNHMVLSARAEDQSPMTVMAYGGLTSAAADLLKVWTGAVTDTFDFDWILPPLQPESGHTMGLWHLNEGTGSSVADAGGNGNTGAIAGNPIWTTDVPFGYGLALDGTGDFITVPSAGSLNIDPTTGALTMEVWVYPTRTGGGYETIIGKWTSASNINYQMSLHMTSDNLLFYTGTTIWTSDVHVPINEWSYLAITLDAADHVAHFYRNGVEGTPISSVTFGTANTAPLTIGSRNSAGSEFVWGRIDEVRLTNRALSAAEIAANYELSAGRYFWKYTAGDGSNPLTTSEVRSFYVGIQPAPDMPTLLQPVNALLTNDNTPMFVWSTAARAETYTLEYARDAAFTTGKVTVPGLADTTFTPGTGLGEGVWYWHAQAVNTGGGSGYQTTPFTFTIDTQAPAGPTGFTVQPGHGKITLGWTNASSDFDHTVIMRSPWYAGGAGYPEYDDANAEGPYPADTSTFTKVYSGTGTAHVDNVSARDVYHYTVFTVDAAGNVSTATTAQQGRATNYWLGDKTGDGQVYYQDLTYLSNAYWTTPASPNWDAEFDIGPTYTGSAQGIPTTDNVVSFEDMIIFAINFNTVAPLAKEISLLPGSGSGGRLGLSLAAPAEAMTVGQEVTVGVMLENNPGSVKGIHCLLPYDPAAVEVVRIEPGIGLTDAAYPVFFDGRLRDRQIDLSLALLGEGLTIGGSGEIARITFRVLGPAAGSLEFGLIDIRDGDNAVLVAEQKGVEYGQLAVPREYALRQNRPNPFNPTTEIVFELPQAGAVTLTVYNIQGQVVRTLVDGYVSAGVHTVVWNSCDEAGRRVASGVYLYRLIAGHRSLTRQMVLLK